MSRVEPQAHLRAEDGQHQSTYTRLHHSPLEHLVRTRTQGGLPQRSWFGGRPASRLTLPASHCVQPVQPLLGAQLLGTPLPSEAGMLGRGMQTPLTRGPCPQGASLPRDRHSQYCSPRQRNNHCGTGWERLGWGGGEAGVGWRRCLSQVRPFSYTWKGVDPRPEW